MSRNRFEFTARALETLCLPQDRRRAYYFDTQTRGLAISVSSAGTRSFYYCRKTLGHNRRKCLGRFPEMSLEEARARANEMSSAIAQGQNPFDVPTVQIPTDITLGHLFEIYMELHARQHCKRWQDMQASFRRNLPCFSARATASIARIEVQSWLNALGKRSPHLANRNYDLLRAIIGWGIKKEIISHRNPCLGVDRYKLKPRDRFVQPGDEFDRLAAAIDAEEDETIRDFFWMCLFTGARKTNLLTMRWEHINFDLGSWNIPDTKNGDSQLISLIPEAISLLKRRKATARTAWVFESSRTPGHYACPKSAWNRIRQRANTPDLRIHDLRRTLGSYMAIQGTSSTIIGKALGHRSLAATAIYARLTQSAVRDAVSSALAPLLTRRQSSSQQPHDPASDASIASTSILR